MPSVVLRESTRTALQNLFAILDIREDSFDGCLFELASRAFSAQSDLSKSRRTLRERSANGQKKARRQLEIKMDTYLALQELHGRLFPYLPWTSWDWYLRELAKIAEEHVYERAGEIHSE